MPIELPLVVNVNFDLSEEITVRSAIKTIIGQFNQKLHDMRHPIRLEEEPDLFHLQLANEKGEPDFSEPRIFDFLFFSLTFLCRAGLEMTESFSRATQNEFYLVLRLVSDRTLRLGSLNDSMMTINGFYGKRGSPKTLGTSASGKKSEEKGSINSFGSIKIQRKKRNIFWMCCPCLEGREEPKTINTADNHLSLEKK